MDEPERRVGRTGGQRHLFQRHFYDKWGWTRYVRNFGWNVLCLSTAFRRRFDRSPSEQYPHERLCRGRRHDPGNTHLECGASFRILQSESSFPELQTEYRGNCTQPVRQLRGGGLSILGKAYSQRKYIYGILLVGWIELDSDRREPDNNDAAERADWSGSQQRIHKQSGHRHVR